MSPRRLALVALLSLLAPACNGDDDGGPPAETEDDGAHDGGGEDGAGQDDGAGDDGGSIVGACEGAEVDEVTAGASVAEGAGSMAVSDGGAIYVAFAGRSQVSAEEGLWLTRLGDGGWADPEAVPVDAEREHTRPLLAAHGETLHLVWSTSRADGARDIMYASRAADGIWSEPLDLTAEENQEGRTSTSARALAVGPAGELAIAYGTRAEADGFDSIRLLMVSEGAAATAPLDVPPGDRACDHASVAFDADGFAHVVASCEDDETASAFLTYNVGDGVGWLSRAQLAENLFSFNLAPSLAPLVDGHVSMAWESRRTCAQGECGHVMYAVDAALGFPLRADLSAAAPSDPGDGSPSLVIDAAARVTVAFHRASAATPAEVLVVHSDEVTEPSQPPAFSEPCRLPTPAGQEAVSPRALVDPTTGDLHVLLRQGAGDEARLAHARVPAWP